MALHPAAARRTALSVFALSALALALPRVPEPTPALREAAAPTELTPLLRPLAEQVAEVERAAIAAALKTSGGNRVRAARRLGMSRAALYDRLGRYPDLGA